MSTTGPQIDPRSGVGSTLPRGTIYVLFIFGVIMALLIGLAPERASSNDPAVAADCARRDTQATAAIPKKLAARSVVGRRGYERSMSMWLAEARRYCANGSGGRAERYYRRIVDS
jgi:hypothetical protein